MPEQTYPEEVRYERDGESIGVYIAEAYLDPDVNDAGHVTHTPCAHVIINTDAQRPFTEDERETWADELRADITERLRD